MIRAKWSAAVVILSLALVGCGGVKKPNATQPGSPAANYQKGSGTAAQTPAAQPAPTPTKKQWQQPPAMQIDTAKNYSAIIKTDMGDIELELFVKDAPRTVNNFVFLAKEGFYDGVIFHRIINGFMVQTGDPAGNGTGGPGYRFADELPVKRPYDPGIVAMANAGKDTNGSQFFICNGADCRNLDRIPNYTQFGKVTKGMDVVAKISAVEVVAGAGGEVSRPKTPPKILSVVVESR